VGIERRAPGSDVFGPVGDDRSRRGRHRQVDHDAIRAGIPQHVGEKARHIGLSDRGRGSSERQVKEHVGAGARPDLPCRTPQDIHAQRTKPGGEVYGTKRCHG
jgi:hypothetical protein